MVNQGRGKVRLGARYGVYPVCCLYLVITTEYRPKEAYIPPRKALFKTSERVAVILRVSFTVSTHDSEYAHRLTVVDLQFTPGQQRLLECPLPQHAFLLIKLCRNHHCGYLFTLGTHFCTQDSPSQAKVAS